jgi:hypothetical protein
MVGNGPGVILGVLLVGLLILLLAVWLLWFLRRRPADTGDSSGDNHSIPPDPGNIPPDENFQVDPASPNVHVVRDAQGRVIHVEHIRVFGLAVAQADPRTLADAYVRANAALFDPELQLALAEPISGAFRRDEPPLLRYAAERSIRGRDGSTVVTYAQTVNGLPIWQAGLAVTVNYHDGRRLRVNSAQSSLHPQPLIDPAPPRDAQFVPNKLSLTTLTRLLYPDNLPATEQIRINVRPRLLYYRYRPLERFATPVASPQAATAAAVPAGASLDAPLGAGAGRAVGGLDPGPLALADAPPTDPFAEPNTTLPLAPVPQSIRTEVHYLVTEVLFATTEVRKDGLHPDVNWRAFIEVRTGAVLYLRAAVAACFDEIFPPGPAPGAPEFVSAAGSVFAADPVTLTGDDPFAPGRTPSDATLNPQPIPVTLANVLTSTNGAQSLNGAWVTLQDLNSPVGNPPSDVNTPFDFTFPAVDDSDNFTAVNAYYHTDAMYRMVDQLGMLGDFFAAGQPVRVDAQGMGNSPNALTFGDGTHTRVSKIYFGRGRPASDVGNAIDIRVVLHEFCHALLWARVQGPNLGFAHSAGDSLAAILNDPCSQVAVANRYQTFPWIMLENPTWPGRFHGGPQRTVAAGWGWGGTIDGNEQQGSSTSGGYDREQILSTTLFRIYEAIGGDPQNPLEERQQAARYVAYLIIRAIGTLPSATFTPTNSPDEFATALMIADTGTAPAGNPTGGAIPGGSINKIIRWSFETQGLYQPPGAPTPVTSAGQPPVDVYIGQTRALYDLFRPDFYETGDLWNRRNPDAGTAHEDPVPNQPNYVYVRVRNRGYQAAIPVTISGFYAPQAPDLVWERAGGWQPMAPPLTPFTDPLGAAGSGTDTAVVGPYQWTPDNSPQSCLLMTVSAPGDPSNIDATSSFPCAIGPTPLDQLARFDNNIAVRTV